MVLNRIKKVVWKKMENRKKEKKSWEDNAEVRGERRWVGCLIADVDEVEVLNVPNMPRGARYFQVGNDVDKIKRMVAPVDTAMKKILKI